jgi:hypothetical protein
MILITQQYFRLKLGALKDDILASLPQTPFKGDSLEQDWLRNQS